MKKRNWITVNCSMIFLFQDFFFFPFLSYQRKVKKVPRGKIDYLQNSCNKKAGKKKRGKGCRQNRAGNFRLPKHLASFQFYYLSYTKNCKFYNAPTSLRVASTGHKYITSVNKNHMHRFFLKVTNVLIFHNVLL